MTDPTTPPGMPVSAHFQALVESSEDAIASKTLDGIITSWNHGAERLFGYRAAEMIGQPVLRLFPPDRLAEEDMLIARIRRGERVEHYETVRVRKDGTPVHVSVTLSPILDAQGTIVGVSKIARDVGERLALQAAARHFEAVVATTQDAIVTKTLDGIVTSWNPGAERIFGYTAQEMLGQPIVRLMPPDRVHEEPLILEAIRQGQRVEHFDTVRVRKDGQLVEVSVTLSPLRDHRGQVVGASKIARNITARKAAEARLRLTAGVFTYASEGIAILDAQGRIVEVNGAMELISGYGREELLGQRPDMFASSRQGPEVHAALLQALHTDGHCRGEVWSRRKNGEAYAALLTVSVVRGDDGQVRNYVALVCDITPLRRQQEQLEHAAHHDALTDLPNRLLLSDRLQRALLQSRRHDTAVAVLYLDLDEFKAINDQRGHEVGDELLVALARRMQAVLRETDTLARMGGDEFVAVLADLPHSTGWADLVDRLLHACSDPITVGGEVLQVSASVGVAIYPHDNADADQLMRHADQAMYQAKQSGKNRYHLFDPVHDAAARSRRDQLDQITQALARQEFQLYYQPKVHMRSGAVMGVEALLRWQHPHLGLLAPGAFLPVIEGHALMEQVGAWVLQTALAQKAAWQVRGIRLPVSVNVAARQLQQPDFVLQLTQALGLHPDLDPTELELEILETSALDDLHEVTAIMQACHHLGVRFAVDDFGTGYSSLTYLRRLPAETLKIDQSFVRDMLEDREDLAIVHGVIGLAAAFGRHVIAEGVETVEHGLRLLDLGCEWAQGYGVARPMPAQELPVWLAQWQPPAAWTQHVRASTSPPAGDMQSLLNS